MCAVILCTKTWCLVKKKKKKEDIEIIFMVQMTPVIIGVPNNLKFYKSVCIIVFVFFL